VVLRGIGASIETAKATVETIEDLLRKATRKLWLARNKEQQQEEEVRHITAEQKRDVAAAKEWREKNPIIIEEEEEVEEGEPGMVTRDGGGRR
jgi:C4-type Zn-finger protein